MDFHSDNTTFSYGKMLNMNTNFDIKAYLDDKEIPYRTGGDNVTSGWVEITCPYCSDHAEHFGINLKSLWCKCWLCNKSIPATELIKTIEKCSEGIARQIIKQFPLEDLPWQEEEEPIHNTTLILPSCEEEWPQIHLDYLQSRGFNPEEIITKFHLRPVYTIGKYRFRIIIPIYINHELVSFTSMDVLRDGQRPPYMDAPKDQVIIPVKECLYNIDSVKDKCLIFEGVTGVWRFGDGSVASFTSNLMKEQISLLVKKKVKSVFVLFDPDASDKGSNIANQLSGIIPHVEQIKFSSGDPKDLSVEEMAVLKKDLGF